MKKSKIAILLLSGLALATSASANNVAGTGNTIVDATVGVTAYVAAGLSATASGMEFGAVVVHPTNDSTVTVQCNGKVSYSVGAAPAGANSGDTGVQNAGATTQSAPQTGQFLIKGEPNYAISVSVASATGLPTNMTFTPYLKKVGCMESEIGAVAANTQLDSSGDLDLILYGELKVGTGFVLSGNQSVSTNAIVNVNYR